MASQNILLGSGLPQIPQIPGHKERTQNKTPVFRYHKDCPGGKVINYDDELEKLGQGWVDHPGKIRRLPGHEKLYDDFNKINKPIEKPTVVSEDAIKAEMLKAESDKYEKKRLEDLEKLSKPSHVCLVCGKVFKSERALNMHGIGAHRNKKDLTKDETNLIEEEKAEILL